MGSCGSHWDHRLSSLSKRECIRRAPGTFRRDVRLRLWVGKWKRCGSVSGSGELETRRFHILRGMHRLGFPVPSDCPKGEEATP